MRCAALIFLSFLSICTALPQLGATEPVLTIPAPAQPSKLVPKSTLKSTSSLNVLQQLAAQATLSNFTELINTAGIAAKFTDLTSLVTVFAPTNAAVAKLTSAQLKVFNTHKGLLHHAVYGNILTTSLKPTQDVETLNGDKIVITRGKTAAGVEHVHVATALVTKG